METSEISKGTQMGLHVCYVLAFVGVAGAGRTAI
jgi:hypothetical protein